MLDFGIMPPEIISGQIYAGPGAGSLLAAATSWQGVATELESFALSYSSVLADLLGVWRGPSALAMTQAVFPYIAWAHSAAAQAAQMAIAMESAANTFYIALGSAVPPLIVTANRVQVMELVATNILGQNTPAIMAAEAQYAEMWAQDVAAMTAYQSGSRAATSSVAPFATAPSGILPFLEGVGPLGTVVQAIFSATPGELANQYLQAWLSSGFPVDLLALFAASSIASGVNEQANAMAVGGAGGAARTILPPSPPTPGEPTASSVSAVMGQGERIGRLSTPPSWAQRPPEPSRARPLPITSGGSTEEESVGIPVIPAVPVTGGKARKRKGTDPDSMDYGKPMPPILFRHPSGG